MDAWAPSAAACAQRLLDGLRLAEADARYGVLADFFDEFRGEPTPIAFRLEVFCVVWAEFVRLRDGSSLRSLRQISDFLHSEDPDGVVALCDRCDCLEGFHEEDFNWTATPLPWEPDYPRAL